MAVLGRYLYCVIPCKEERDFGEMGIGDVPAKVYTLHHQDLALVVSKARFTTYDPTRKNALAHEKVISTVMKEFPVIPMSFGLVSTDEQAAQTVLSKHYKSFRDKLDYITGKIEIGLKVWWKKECFETEILGSDPRLLRLKQEIEKHPEKNNYLLSVDFGKMVEQAANELRKKYEEQLVGSLQELAVDTKLNSLIGELMVFNAAFLIEKTRENAFDLKVNELYLAHQDRLNFKYTGPWPPYNFVDLRITDL